VSTDKPLRTVDIALETNSVCNCVKCKDLISHNLCSNIRCVGRILRLFSRQQLIDMSPVHVTNYGGEVTNRDETREKSLLADSVSLANSISLTLRQLTVWGLYTGGFYDNKTVEFTQPRHDKEAPKCADASLKYTSKYPLVICVVLWITCLRLLFVFNADDVFGLLIFEKFVVFMMFLQVALLHTSYFVTSRSGQLDRLLDVIRVSPHLAARYRKLSLISVILETAISIPASVLLVYGLFMKDSKFQFLIAPFTTLIPIDGVWMTVMSSLVSIVIVFAVQTWLCSTIMNQIITNVLYRLYRQINDEFREAIDRRGSFKSRIRVFRCRHHALSTMVRTADSFMMVGNVTNVFMTCPPPVHDGYVRQ